MKITLAVILAIAIPLAAAPVCSSITTTVPQTYPADASSLHTGDFDGDGNVDVISGGHFPGATVLYGRGDGTLEPPIVLMRDVKSEVYPGDVNGDGRTDVIGWRGQYESAEIVVAIATGARTFAPPVLVPIPPNGELLGAGDFTSDGRTDFLVARQPDLQVLAADGQGGYAVIGALKGVFLDPVEIADVDGDGNLDLLTENERYFRLFRGTGTGRFNGPDQIGPALTPTVAVVGDLTGDARPDIISLEFKAVRVFDGPVRGPRLAGKQILNIDDSPLAGVAGDFNGDGANDLALLDYRSHLVIYMNDGRGNFGYRWELMADYGRVATADFDRDGLLDLVVAGPGVTILRGNGDGTFPSARMVPSSPHPYTELDGSADFDGDGIDELIGVEVHEVHVGWSNGVSVLFERVRTGVSVNEYINPRTVAVAEMDAQPGPEIVIGADKRLIIVSRRTGIWQQPSEQQLQLSSQIESLAVFDRRVALVSRDGKVSVRETDGTVQTVGDVGYGNAWLELAAADVDGDSLKDLIVLAAGDAIYPGVPDILGPGSAINGEVFVMRGAAGGTFAPPEKIFSGFGMTHVVAADFNADRFVDLVVSTEDGGVHLLVNESAGNFAPVKIDDSNSDELAVRDVDGDRRPDLVTNSAGGVALYRSSSAGLTRAGSWMSSWMSGAGLAVAQLRRDAPPSLVTAFQYYWQLVAVDFECGPRRRGVRH